MSSFLVIFFCYFIYYYYFKFICLKKYVNKCCNIYFNNNIEKGFKLSGFNKNNILDSFRSRNLDLSLLADSVLYWRSKHVSATTCYKFRCFKAGGMPKTISQIKDILDFNCPGWEDPIKMHDYLISNGFISSPNDGESNDLRENKDRLKKALNYIINSRVKRGSFSARNDKSITSSILSALERSLDFKSEKNNTLVSVQNNPNNVNDRYFQRHSLNNADFFKSVKGDIKAMHDEVNDYLRRSVWRADAKLTLSGLIHFCEDYPDLEKAYNKIIKFKKNNRVGYFKNINIIGKRNKASLQLNFLETLMGKRVMSIIYSTDRDDLDKYLRYNKPFEKSVAFHLEPYRNYEDFSVSMRFLFNQFFKSYQNACLRGRKTEFYGLLYGQYCIDTRTDKVFKKFLSPDNFADSFYDIVQPVYFNAIEFLLLSGREDNYDNLMSCLIENCEGLMCIYNSGLSNNIQSNKINLVKINKKMLSDFLVDIMCIDKPQRSSSKCCNIFLSSLCFRNNKTTNSSSSGLIENNKKSKFKSKSKSNTKKSSIEDSSVLDMHSSFL